MRFQNPANGYVEHCSVPFLWALIFGPLYFVLKGIWRHVVLYFIVNGILLTVVGFAMGFAAMAAGSVAIAMGGGDTERVRNLMLIGPPVLVAALVLPFLIYPFIAGGIVRRHFLRQGWVEVDGYGEPLPF